MKTIFSLLSISLLTVIMNGCDKPMITPEDNLNGNINEPPTVTVPSTIFVAFQDYNVSNFGDYLTKEFTVNEKTKFVFRFASAYNAQAAIFTDDQLNNFTSLHAFTGYGLFDNQVGTQTVTLNPGTYYLGVRNTTHSENSFSAELDYTYSLPASDRCSFNDVYIQAVKTFSGNGGWITNEFTVQKGFRYFLDGCNVGFETYIIPAGDIPAFQNGQTFNYYTDYYDATGAGPGFFEINLPEGNYAIAARSSAVSAIAFTMERWKVN